MLRYFDLSRDTCFICLFMNLDQGFVEIYNGKLGQNVFLNPPICSQFKMQITRNPTTLQFASFLPKLLLPCHCERCCHCKVETLFRKSNSKFGAVWCQTRLSVKLFWRSIRAEALTQIAHSEAHICQYPPSPQQKYHRTISHALHWLDMNGVMWVSGGETSDQRPSFQLFTEKATLPGTCCAREGRSGHQRVEARTWGSQSKTSSYLGKVASTKAKLTEWIRHNWRQ